MVYPSTLSSFTDPVPTDRLSTTPHSAIETAQNNGLRELQAFVGSASSVVGTLIYDIRATASDGGGHIQVANKGGTGLTSYTKGDILVATSSSVLTKLAVSSVESYALITDSSQAAGVKWGLPGGIPTVRLYTSSTMTWTKPSILTYAVVELAGGGGGASFTTNANDWHNEGGRSGYARKIIPASALGATVIVNAGLAGAGGTLGLSVGSVGGISSFGSIFSATGGGSGGTALGLGGMGAFGTATGGDLNITGGGVPGGRGFQSQTNNDENGEAGQDGYVIVTEY